MKKNIKNMLDDINCSNYYDEATNITYTNGIRSIYIYCKKYNFNFKNVVLDLCLKQVFIPKKFNLKTAGLEVV